jgi:hypothetical protein
MSARDGMLERFAAHAVLLDNGKRFEGHAELRTLFEDEVISVKAIFMPDAVRLADGQVVVEGPAHGDFKGSPIRFAYRFTSKATLSKPWRSRHMTIKANPTEFAGKRVLIRGGTKSKSAACPIERQTRGYFSEAAASRISRTRSARSLKLNGFVSSWTPLSKRP